MSETWWAPGGTADPATGDRGTMDRGTEAADGWGDWLNPSAAGGYALSTLIPGPANLIPLEVTVNAGSLGAGLGAGLIAGSMPQSWKDALNAGIAGVGMPFILVWHIDSLIVGIYDGIVEELWGWWELLKGIFSWDAWAKLFTQIGQALEILFAGPEKAFYVGWELGKAVTGSMSQALAGPYDKLAYGVGKILGPFILDAVLVWAAGTGIAKMFARLGKDALYGAIMRIVRILDGAPIPDEAINAMRRSEAGEVLEGALGTVDDVRQPPNPPDPPVVPDPPKAPGPPLQLDPPPVKSEKPPSAPAEKPPKQAEIPADEPVQASNRAPDDMADDVVDDLADDLAGDVPDGQKIPDGEPGIDDVERGLGTRQSQTPDIDNKPPTPADPPSSVAVADDIDDIGRQGQGPQQTVDQGGQGTQGAQGGQGTQGAQGGQGQQRSAAQPMDRPQGGLGQRPDATVDPDRRGLGQGNRTGDAPPDAAAGLDDAADDLARQRDGAPSSADQGLEKPPGDGVSEVELDDIRRRIEAERGRPLDEDELLMLRDDPYIFDEADDIAEVLPGHEAVELSGSKRDWWLGSTLSRKSLKKLRKILKTMADEGKLVVRKADGTEINLKDLPDKEVDKILEKMKSDGKWKDKKGNDLGEVMVKGSDGKLYPFEECDMGHRKDAVTGWNERRGQEVPKSRDVRDWMLDEDNYELEPSAINRGKGTGGETYDYPEVRARDPDIDSDDLPGDTIYMSDEEYIERSHWYQDGRAIGDRGTGDPGVD